jgi:hypothetical protein
MHNAASKKLLCKEKDSIRAQNFTVVWWLLPLAKCLLNFLQETEKERTQRFLQGDALPFSLNTPSPRRSSRVFCQVTSRRFTLYLIYSSL